MKKLHILFIVLCSMIVSSCDMEINQDPNYPEEINADKYFTSGTLFVSSAVGGDLQLIGGMWAQHYAQNAGSNQYTNIDSYNIPVSSTYVTRSWSALYAGAIPDFKLAMDKAAAKGDWHFWMASKIMTAYTFHILVDAYGDVPFSEATQFETIVNPKYDDAKTINGELIKMLDEAIAKKAEALTAAEVKPMGNSDLIFKGNVDNWVKFAKSLKLKILMRDPAFANNSAAISALLADDDLLTDAVNEAKVAVFENKENVSNPLFENDRRKLNTSQNVRVSSTLVRYLQSTGDPRISVFSEIAYEKGPTTYFGMPQGGYTLGSSYYPGYTSRALIKATDPVYFISYAEVEFLKAEALVKLNRAAEAKGFYDKGVTAAFERWRGAKDEDDIKFVFPNIDIQNYIGAGRPYEFNQTSTQTMLESIWRQKWISFARAQAFEAFLEINRTGYPTYGNVTATSGSYVVGTLATSINTVLPAGEFPRRLIYPKTSIDYNSNAPTPLSIQTKMWWHKQ